MMQITDLHDIIDDVPVEYFGVKLKEEKLDYIGGDDLEQLIKESDVKPVTTKIERGSPHTGALYNPKFLYQMFTFKWRLKKRLKKRDYDFAIVQIGAYNICYDFYKDI